MKQMRRKRQQPARAWNIPRIVEIPMPRGQTPRSWRHKPPTISQIVARAIRADRNKRAGEALLRRYGL